MRPLRDAFETFQRAPLLSALSVTTIAFSLFALGLFGLVALNIREALERLEDRVEIRAFVAEGTPPEDILQAASDIASFPEVLRADLVTQEQALKRAQAELGEFRDVMDGHPLWKPVAPHAAVRILARLGDRLGMIERSRALSRVVEVPLAHGARSSRAPYPSGGRNVRAR